MPIVYRIYAFLTVIVALSCHAQALRPRYVIEWESFDCVSQMVQVPNISCQIERHPKPHKISVSYLLAQPLTEGWMKYVLLVPRPPNRSYTKLFEGDLDMCQFLIDRKPKNRLLMKIFQSMIKYSNMPKQCPIEKGWLHIYNISALDYFPAFLPETEFKLIMKLYKPNQENSIDITLKGSVVETARKNFFIIHKL